MLISIIIPTYNEAEGIEQFLEKLLEQVHGHAVEIIISDASDDNTLDLLQKYGVKSVKSEIGRAKQMNDGAKLAQGDFLFFIHADTILPQNFLAEVTNAIKAGAKAGCFRMQFDSHHWLMRSYGYFTRLPFIWCRGGDQTLFVENNLFNQVGGYDEQFQIMEDIDFIKKVKALVHFHIIPKEVKTSARKYDVNGKLRLQLIFAYLHLLYAFGARQEKLIAVYEKYVI